MLPQPCQQPCSGLKPTRLSHRLPISDQGKRRYPLDPELTRNLLLLIRVDLHK